MAPLATGAHEIEQAVEQAAHVCGPRPPAGLSWRNERFDQAILVIAQSLARSKVADPSAIRGRPHCGLQTGKGSGGTLSTALVARQTNQHTLSKRALTRFGVAGIVQPHPAPELVLAGSTAGSPALPTVLIFGFGAPATQSPGALAIGRCAVGGG